VFVSLAWQIDGGDRLVVDVESQDHCLVDVEEVNRAVQIEGLAADFSVQPLR